MKLFYILILTLVFALTSNAQNFIYPVGQNIVGDVVMENYESYPIDINTPDFEAIQYDWQLISNTFPTAWSYSLCDYGECSVGVPPSGSMTSISLSEAQDSVIGWFKLNLTVGMNYGQGKIEIYVYDSNDFNRGDTISWDITWTEQFASTTDLSKTAFSFFPNPASDILNISLAGAINGNVYNNIGQSVMSFEGMDKIKVDVSDLNPGIYFVKTQDKAGLVYSKKLIIK